MTDIHKPFWTNFVAERDKNAVLMAFDYPSHAEALRFRLEDTKDGFDVVTVGPLSAAPLFLTPAEEEQDREPPADFFA